MSGMLEIENLYGGYEKEVSVLQGINLAVDKGDVVGIIGLNGSGKSTLSKAVMNLLPYRSGVIRYEGQDISAKNTSELARMGFAFMQQGGVVFQNLSVWDNLQMAFGKHGDEAYREQLKEIVPLLKEPQKKLARAMADKLSGGQRHQLALAMALANRPSLLILDEPSAGLSPKAVDKMYESLTQVRECFGTTMLIVEQNLAKAVQFCDRCVMMELGAITNVYVYKKQGLFGIGNALLNVDW